MHDKLKAIRIEDSLLRLEALHILRQTLLEAFPDKKDTELYIEANEAINEMESKVWEYINRISVNN